jgi:hypothetical protein
MDLYSGFPKATITDRPFGSKVDAQSSTSCNQESLFWQKVEEMHKAAAKAKEMERVSDQCFPFPRTEDGAHSTHS